MQSDIIVPVQRGSQVVMARCADCLVFLASVGPRAILGLPFVARYGPVVLPDPGCFALVEDLCQGGPWDEFDYEGPPSEARTPLDMAGSRELERDVHGMEHDKQLFRPMRGSATMSCVDDKNLNATEDHEELVTINISDSLLQLLELHESSSLRDPLLGVSSHALATGEGGEMNFFEQGHNNPPEVCPSDVGCSIPQVMGLIGIMLVGSLTAFNSSVFLPMKNSRGGAPSRCLSLKVIGHVDVSLLSPICLFAISGMSAIVLHAHFQKLGPGEWPKLREQDTPPLSASHSCRATQGTSIESLIDRILTVPEILPPDECPKDREITETVIERWVQQLADPNLGCAEFDSQCESSPSTDKGSVSPDVPPDEVMGRYGFLRDEEGLETLENLLVVAKQVETQSSISSSNLLGHGFDSQDSGKCMELRPRENPKDRKESRQLYWRKVAALTETSRPPTKRTSIYPQGNKEGRFSLHPQWFHRILDWAGDEFQPQCYPFADPRSSTKVKRPGKRAGVWVNTPKGGAAVTQGLNKLWHDDTIFVLCPHKYLQQVAEKAIWEGSRGIMIVPRQKNKEWFLGLSEVTVDWWDLLHDA